MRISVSQGRLLGLSLPALFLLSGCLNETSRDLNSITKAELVVQRNPNGLETKIVFSKDNQWAIWQGDQKVGKGIQVPKAEADEFWESLKNLPAEGEYFTELDALEFRCFFDDGQILSYPLNRKTKNKSKALHSCVLLISGMAKW